MTRKDEWVQPADEQRVLWHTQQAIASMCSFYRLNRQFVVDWVISRKNLQVVKCSVHVDEWEQHVLSKYSQEFAQQRAALINELVAKHVVPYHENFYKTKVLWCKVFHVYQDVEWISSLSVKCFDKPIFKAVKPHFVNEEEVLANAISQGIKERNRRGPDRIVTAISEVCTLVVITGLLPGFMCDYIGKHPREKGSMERMLSSMLEEAICEACQEVFARSDLKITFNMDFGQDRIIALVFFAS